MHMDNANINDHRHNDEMKETVEHKQTSLKSSQTNIHLLAVFKISHIPRCLSRV